MNSRLSLKNDSQKEFKVQFLHNLTTFGYLYSKVVEIREMKSHQIHYTIHIAIIEMHFSFISRNYKKFQMNTFMFKFTMVDIMKILYSS